MKKSIFALASSLFMGLLLFVGCNETPSPIGDTIRPNEDLLRPQVDSFRLKVSTILADSIYDRSTLALLGHFNDRLYGTYRASYISRLQHTPGFKFRFQPHNGKITRTEVKLRYTGWVGDSTLYSKVNVFEVKKPLPKDRYTKDLTPYTEGAKLLGSLSYRAGNETGLRELVIPIDNELGERFYKASIENPSFFESQESFEENLLRGFYVNTSTGSGCMLTVYSTELVIYYDYEMQGKTKDKSADSTYLVEWSENFTNSAHLFLHRQFEITNIDGILAPNNQHAFVTSPKGVLLSLTLSAQDLQDTFVETNETSSTIKQLINGAPLELLADVPPMGETILQPPAHLLLLPQDSLLSFFEKGHTELSQPETSFLSSIYNVNTRRYQFNNISLLLNEHIRNNLKEDAHGKKVVAKDLNMVVVPVARETTGSGAGRVTAKLGNYIYPSAVRIQLDEGTLKLKTISTLYSDN